MRDIKLKTIRYFAEPFSMFPAFGKDKTGEHCTGEQRSSRALILIIPIFS